MQRWAGPEVALALDEQMPDQDGQLAGRRDGSHVLTATRPETGSERPPRERSARGTALSRSRRKTSNPRPFGRSSVSPRATSSDIVCVEAMWHLLKDEALTCS